MTIRLQRRFLAIWFALAVGFWPLLVLLKGYHPFDLDFAIYRAAALALRAHGAAAIDDAASLAAAAHTFHAAGILVAPAEYPPVFFLELAPLTLLPPAVAFVLWTLLNGAAAVWVLRTLAMRGGDKTWVATAAMLLFFPLMFGFYLGQPTGLLLYSFYRAYRALENGQDLRAGLWLGGLLVKPQYTVVLALVLLWKRRWPTVAGLAAVGAAVSLCSLLLLGPSGTRAYLTLLTAAGGYHTTISELASQIMISWHGLLAALAPALAETPTLALTVALSALSVAALIPIWRGPWQPRDQRFAGQMLATMVVTQLAGYDSNIHGAALLLVPGAALVLTKPGATPHLSLLRFAFFLPGAVLPFALDLTGSLTGEAVVIILLQVVVLAALTLGELQYSWQPGSQPLPGGAMRRTFRRVDATPGRDTDGQRAASRQGTRV